MVDFKKPMNITFRKNRALQGMENMFKAHADSLTLGLSTKHQFENHTISYSERRPATNLKASAGERHKLAGTLSSDGHVGRCHFTISFYLANSRVGVCHLGTLPLTC